MAGNQFGPLIDLPQGQPPPDLGARFLSAFQIGASINAKQQALENQLAQYALKAQNMEHSQAMREAQFDMASKKQAWDMEKFAATMDFKNWQEQNDLTQYKSSLDLRQIAEERRGASEDRRREKMEDYNEAYAGASAELVRLNSMGKGVGTKDFVPEFEKATVDWARKDAKAVADAKAEAYKQSNLYDQHVAAGLKDREKAFYENLGRDYGAGNTLTQDTNMIMHYEDLEDEEVGWHVPYFQTAKTSGKKKITRPGLDPIYVPIPELERKRQQLLQIRKEDENRSGQISRPDLGVYPTTGITAEPAPSNPAQREQNKVYTTPKGQFRWVNNQWVPP